MFDLPLLIGVTVPDPVAYGALALLAFGGVVMALKVDGKVEARREASIALARLASEEGFPHVAPILDAYAIGDYSGVAGGVKAFTSMMLDPQSRQQAFRAMLKVQFGRFVNDKAKLESMQQVAGEHGFKLVKIEEPAAAKAA